MGSADPEPTDPAGVLASGRYHSSADKHKTEAKRLLWPSIRAAQGAVRYEDPGTPGKLWKPTDWWIHHEPLVWLHMPTAPDTLFAVYPCEGNCAAAAIAHRNELAE